MKWEEKRRRIKQVQVQEKIFHKKRLQYFIGWGARGAEVHYSPLLWQKSFHHICQQARIVRSRFSWLPLLVTLVWSGRCLRQHHWSDRHRRGGRRSQVGVKMLSLCPLQGLTRVEESQMQLQTSGTFLSPLCAWFTSSPSSGTIADAKTRATKWNQTKMKIDVLLIVFSWLFLSIVLVWQREFM